MRNTLPPIKRFAAALLAPAASFLFPLVYFHPLYVVRNGAYYGIQNDFISCFFLFKLNLIKSLHDELRLPLWNPSGMAGYPFHSDPHAQTFYPLNLLLVLWHRAARGLTLIDYQFFTVLAAAIFSAGTFVWLRRLGFKPRSSLYAAAVVSVSLKISDLLPFPNALHTAAWYPWILYSMTGFFLVRSAGERLRDGIALVFSLVCFFTAGYPYNNYYGIFLFVPYAGLLLTPGLREAATGRGGPFSNRLHALGMLGAAAAVAAGACGPHLAHVWRLGKNTAARGGGDWEFSTGHPYGLRDLAGAAVFPPSAQSDGVYYIGILGLLMIVLLMDSVFRRTNEDGPDSRLEKEDAQGNFRGKKLFVLLSVWIGAALYIGMGKNSLLFSLLWRTMPGFQYLREWGRIAVILLPLLGWLLAAAHSRLESLMAGAVDESPRTVARRLAVLTVAYAIVLWLQLRFHFNRSYDAYWLKYFSDLFPLIPRFILAGAAAYAGLFALLFLRGRNRIRLNPGAGPWLLLCFLLALSTFELRGVGVRLWTKRTKVWALEAEAKKDWHEADLAGIGMKSFSIPREDRGEMIFNGPKFFVGLPNDNWGYRNYAAFYNWAEKEKRARDVLLGVADGRKLFFSERLDHESVFGFLADAWRFNDFAKPVFYNGDRLELEVYAPANGYLSFIDNWDPDWKARIDGRPARIDRLFGTFKSVRMVPGTHRVVFSYEPDLFSWRALTPENAKIGN